MSNVFFYEPFHDFERLVNEVLAEGKRPRPTQSMQHFSQREDRAVRTFRPRYARLYSLCSPLTLCRMDLHEDFENNIVTVTFELPGVSKEAIDIQLQNNRLTVSAESKRSTEHGEDGYAVRERMFGKYSRTLQLPRNIQVRT